MTNKFDYFQISDGIRLRFGKWLSVGDKARGSVLFLNGRAEFLEKYFEAFKRLNKLGLNVFSFDWRGQGLSTRLLDNRRKGYVRDFEEYLCDATSFVRKLFAPVATPPRILMGHSMGGHIGLRFLKEHPGIFQKAVLLSPMIDIHTFPFPGYLIRNFARAVVNAGFGQAYVSGGDEPVVNKFEGNCLTSDPIRFESALRLINTNPELALGGVTFGWLDAAYESIAILHRAAYAETIKTPILIFSASEDRVVSNIAQREICRRMPNCRFVQILGARHEILQENDTVQQQFWNDFEEFVFSAKTKKK